MSTPPSTPPRRPNRHPLLINGERLRQSAEPPARGGGPKFTPYTVEENLGRLTPQLEVLRARADEVPRDLRGEDLIIEARLLPQFLAASSFPSALLNAAGLIPIGTRTDRADTLNREGDVVRDQPTKTVYLAASEGLAGLAAVLDGTAGRVSKKAMEDIRALDALNLPEPSITVGDGDLHEAPGALILFESALHGGIGPDGRARPASDVVTARWANFVIELGGVAELDWVRRSGSVTFVPVRLSRQRASEAARFNPLRAVQPMPRVRELPQPEAEILPFDEPSGVSTHHAALRVAVFDGGVNDASPYWQGRVRNLIVGNPGSDAGVQAHGALVTSAMLYGHIKGNSLPEPADIVIDHFAAVPQTGLSHDLHMYWLLDVIEEQVRANSYDVVTICAAPSRLVSDSQVDRWTSTLDNLSYEEQVLFVVAAGNNGGDPEHGGLNRILVPADASNVIAVGAADAPQAPATRAPYSAVGPGRPGAQLQPSGVAFGGTVSEPFIAVDNDGVALRYQGTSCAAPLVTHGLANIAAQIGRTRVSPVNLRAFALHFTEQCRKGQDLLKVGLGHFRDDYSFLQDGLPHEAHILYSGSIARGEYIALALPVPDAHTGSLELRYTLVTSTATNIADAVDYTSAGLEIAFRPHANVYTFSNGKKNEKVDTVGDARRAATLLAEGYRVSAEPASASIGATAKAEAVLRSEGKWESVRVGKHTYRNSERALFRPRVEISHLAREQGTLVKDVPDLDWSLLVSLRAKPGAQLYEQVRDQYRVLATLPAITASVATRSA